jgi:hypothetical protein
MEVNHPSLAAASFAKNSRDQSTSQKPLCEAAFVQRLPYALSYTANLEATDHAVLFYDNLVVAAEYFCAYIEEGINHREVTCITGLEPSRYRRLFEQLGIRVAELENGGYLRNLSDQEFFSEAKWAKEIWSEKGGDALSRNRLDWARGGIRFIHIHESGVKQHDSLQNLMLADGRLHALYAFPAPSICCYDAKVVLEDEPPDFFNGLLRAHNHCMFQGFAMPTSRLLNAQRALIAPRPP